MNQRIKRVRDLLSKEGLTELLVTNLPNIFYLSGFRGSDGALLITKDRQILLVDGRYGTQAKTQAPGFDLIVYPEKVGGIATAISDCGVSTLGFEPRSMTVEFHELLSQKLPKMKWKGVGEWWTALRAQKEPAELDILRKANGIADAAAKDLMKQVKAGMRERDLSTELEYQMKRGAERASFSILVAGGERAALPHAMPTDRPLKSGEMFFLDFGCTYEGYQTDQTLTLAIGDPSSKMKEIYSIVKEAHDRAMGDVKAGAMSKEIDQVARDFIKDRGYGEAFGHGLGHGVGIEVHEYPNVSWRSNSRLEAGMLITIEPGIYLPNVGGVRIEDTIVVTQTGYEVLTGVDKALVSL